MTTELTLTDGGLNGPVTVDWGDGSSDTTISTAPWEASHQYASADTYTVTTTTVQTPSQSDTENVTVPYP